MRGLLCIEPLYHQIVAGNKTQTRRSGGLEVVNKEPDNWEITGWTGEENKLEVVDFCDYRKSLRNIYLKPHYKVGEVLYLKEPTRPFAGSEAISYLFDYAHDHVARKLKWSNKLFMPASAARAFVKITAIRCERLLDISDEDCIAEGIQEVSVSLPDGDSFTGYSNYLRSNKAGVDSSEYYVDAGIHKTNLMGKKDSFLSLFKFANKAKEVPNIWVWVYTFEFLKDKFKIADII